METFSVQLIILFTLLFGNVICGALPVFCLKVLKCFCGSDPGNKNKVVTFLIYFGGGVLISTCFLNLLPKSRQDFELKEESDHLEKGNYISGNTSRPEIATGTSHEHEENFPIPEFIVLCGFFFAYIIMEVMHLFVIPFRNTKRLNAAILHKRFCSCAKRNMECSRTFKEERTEHTPFGFKKIAETGIVTEAALGSEIHRSIDPTAVKGDLMRSSIIAQPIPNYGTIVTDGVGIEHQPPILTPTVLVTNDGSIAVVKPPPVQIEVKFPRDSLVTVFSLSIHAIMQGINVGLRAASSQNWLILLMVCIQQFIITLVVGCELLGGTDKAHQVLMFVGTLSLMSPAGVLMAIFVPSTVSHIPYVVSGTLNALTCGALLYIIFYEILRHNRPDGVQHFKKFCAITLGSVLMALLEYGSGLL